MKLLNRLYMLFIGFCLADLVWIVALCLKLRNG